MLAAPRQPALRRDRLISLDMGEVAQELAQEKERERSGNGARRAISGGPTAASERLARCAASCQFAFACCIGALHSMVGRSGGQKGVQRGQALQYLRLGVSRSGGVLRCGSVWVHHPLARSPSFAPLPSLQAPPTLAAAEAACMLAVYLAAVPNAFPTRTSRVRYTFAGSAEDVVALSLLRCAGVTLAHCMGTGPLFQRWASAPWRSAVAVCGAADAACCMQRCCHAFHCCRAWWRSLAAII